MHLINRFSYEQKLLRAWQALARGDADHNDIHALVESGLIGPIALPPRLIGQMVVDKVVNRLHEFGRKICSMLRW